jgi:predicted ester cyclase
VTGYGLCCAARRGVPGSALHHRGHHRDGRSRGARVRMQGTHLGPLGNLQPTGRSIDVLQINIERFENGRIVEHWRVTDELALMKQLGSR